MFASKHPIIFIFVIPIEVGKLPMYLLIYSLGTLVQQSLIFYPFVYDITSSCFCCVCSNYQCLKVYCSLFCCGFDKKNLRKHLLLIQLTTSKACTNCLGKNKIPVFIQANVCADRNRTLKKTYQHHPRDIAETEKGIPTSS